MPHQTHIIDVGRIVNANHAQQAKTIEALNAAFDEAGEATEADAIRAAHNLLSPSGEPDAEAWAQRIGAKGRAQAIHAIRRLAIKHEIMTTPPGDPSDFSPREVNALPGNRSSDRLARVRI